MAVSIVQSGTDTFSNSTTATVSLTVTAGNSVTVCGIVYGGPTQPAVTVSDGTSYTLAIRGQNTNSPERNDASIHYRHNHPGGAITVTVTNAAGSSDSFGHIRVMEVSGLVNAAPNRTTSNSGNSTTPTSGTTTATTVANCWVLGVLSVDGGSANNGIDVPATTGFSNLFVDQSAAAEMAGSIDAKSVSSTGTQSAAWGTLSATANWAAAIAAFEIAGGASTITGTGAITLGHINVSGAGVRAIPGSGAVTLGHITVAGSGSVSGSVTGTGAITLGPITVAGVGEREIGDVGGTVNLNLPAITVSGTGAVGNVVVGNGAITLGAIDVDGTGTITKVGSGAITLGHISVAGAGLRSVPGAGAITLGPINVSGSANLSISGTGAITLGRIQVQGSETLPEPAKNSGAGRPKRRRRKLLVEINGQDFEVSSEDEARVLLNQAREVAEKAIEKARLAPTRIPRGIARPKITTTAPELKRVVAEARQDIVSLFDGLARDLEISALMRRQVEDEEEEALLRFLM